MGKYGEGRKRRLVIIELGAIASVISAVATVIGLIYGIHKDKKQESNPPDQG